MAEQWLKDNFETPRFVVIYWGDAFCHGDASWTSAEDLYDHVQMDPSVIMTVGVLVYESSTQVSVMSTIIEDGSAGGQVHVIPKGWIISRRELR